MKTVFTILGARPQFIKAAALSKEINSKYNNYLKEEVIHTGQHFDKNMSDNFFKELQINKPNYQLNINKGTQGANTGRMIEEIEKILIEKGPNGVIVYGDTNSTLAGALAACKLKIPIFHIEAGLRSFDRNQPEEQNRVLTDHLSDLCFAPTKQAKINLLKEAIERKRIIRTGDIMADTARIFKKRAFEMSSILQKKNLKNKKFILVTIHRQENTDNKEILKNILESFQNIYLPIIFPIHPRTKKKINEYSLNYLLNKIEVIDPLGFIDMMILEKNADLIITDSGGVQKEAFFQGTKCLTLRKQTEWIESLENGWNTLVNPNLKEKISKTINILINKEIKVKQENLYGNGFASKTIVKSINDFFLKNDR